MLTDVIKDGRHNHILATPEITDQAYYDYAFNGYSIGIVISSKDSWQTNQDQDCFEWRDRGTYLRIGSFNQLYCTWYPFIIAMIIMLISISIQNTIILNSSTAHYNVRQTMQHNKAENSSRFVSLKYRISKRCYRTKRTRLPTFYLSTMWIPVDWMHANRAVWRICDNG